MLTIFLQLRVSFGFNCINKTLTGILSVVLMLAIVMTSAVLVKIKFNLIDSIDCACVCLFIQGLSLDTRHAIISVRCPEIFTSFIHIVPFWHSTVGVHLTF